MVTGTLLRIVAEQAFLRRAQTRRGAELRDREPEAGTLRQDTLFDGAGERQSMLSPPSGR